MYAFQSGDNPSHGKTELYSAVLWGRSPSPSPCPARTCEINVERALGEVPPTLSDVASSLRLQSQANYCNGCLEGRLRRKAARATRNSRKESGYWRSDRRRRLKQSNNRIQEKEECLVFPVLVLTVTNNTPLIKNHICMFL